MTAQTVTKVDFTSPSRLVAAEIRAEIARQGISGREVGRRLGEDQGWVGRRIGVPATRELSVEDILKMAEALGVSAERFLGVLLPRLDSNQQPSGYLHSLATVTPITSARSYRGEVAA